MFRRLAILLLLAAPALAQAPHEGTLAKHAFTFEDMMKLKRVEEPNVSPDGKWVIFGAVDVDLEQNTKTPHIWITPISGPGERAASAGSREPNARAQQPAGAGVAEPSNESQSRQLTNDPAGEDRPRFSPDGKEIAYISSKGSTSQIWLVGFDTATGQLAGAPRQLTSISTEADGEIWAPDGKSLVFISRVFPDCADDACNKARQEALEKSKVKAEIFTHLFFRHWNEYTDFKASHLFVVTASDGVSKDITPGAYDVPPFSLGGPDDYDISPDSRELAYTSNHDAVPAASTNNDIWLVPMSCAGEQPTGAGERMASTGPREPDARAQQPAGAGVAEPSDKCAPKKISTSPGSDSTPRYSPDGKWIAWRMQERGGYESDKFNLVVYDRTNGAIKNLTDGFDRWAESYVWAPDSKRIYLTADDKGGEPLYYLDFPGELHPLQGWHSLDDLTLSKDGEHLLMTVNSVEFPTGIGDLLVTKAVAAHQEKIRSDLAAPASGHEVAGELPRIIDNVNRSLLDQIQMSPFEPFWFTGAHNEKVEGFLLRPPNFDASKKYPVKFIVHGGPEVPFADEWSYRWNSELFAADGYVVIAIAFHGTPGYGQKFIDAIDGDWGGAPFEDLMLGLDYAEQHFPFIDKDRECALGASYGGYMLDWIAGHTTRFKCLVTHDGMSDTEAAYGQTEEMWFPEWEFQGTPWTNRETYRKWNPILAAPNFHTPTLIIHGQRDYRLDVSQGFEFFTTLQRLGVPSKMLYFPDEGHWVLKPQNSRLWYKTVNDWVDEWVNKK